MGLGLLTCDALAEAIERYEEDLYLRQDGSEEYDSILRIFGQEDGDEEIVYIRVGVVTPEVLAYGSGDDSVREALGAYWISLRFSSSEKGILLLFEREEDWSKSLDNLLVEEGETIE